MDKTTFNSEYIKSANPLFFSVVEKTSSVDEMRSVLSGLSFPMDRAVETACLSADSLARIRDCALALRNILKKESDELTGCSVAQAIRDINHGVPRPDLTPAFYAELHYILLGLSPGKHEPRNDFRKTHTSISESDSGRSAAIEKSKHLDKLWGEVDRWISKYETGLNDDAIIRRRERRDRILDVLGASLKDWHDWHWQIRHIVRDVDDLDKLVMLTDEQKEAVSEARRAKLPFGVTPYYLSLMDDEKSNRDMAIRAQVLPPLDYVRKVSAVEDRSTLDFMGERDTSPFDLITRRYPAVLILKPFNACPQICVYCQRNWEIEDAMASGAFAGMERIDAAIKWISEHPAIHEVLVTGGDPLAMGDSTIRNVLEKVAAIPTIERIRIGTRVLVTMPMRVTARIAEMIGELRRPGKREVCVVTHVQHPYEITPDVITAVDRLRRHGISVYNQFVYTFFSSRRFEATALRRLLKLAGIDPYYTFNTKGKKETSAYRAPIARLLQECDEEARFLPGLARTDEAVFNLPRLGKCYLRSKEYRSLLSIAPDGSRIYEFYPWVKNISFDNQTYLYTDIPILEYLERLEKVGENVSDYDTIWYYY